VCVCVSLNSRTVRLAERRESYENGGRETAYEL